MSPFRQPNEFCCTCAHLLCVNIAAWGLFMSDSYKDLRQLVCGTPEDLARFRQVLVNSVMSTDIFDKDLKAMRDA